MFVGGRKGIPSIIAFGALRRCVYCQFRTCLCSLCATQWPDEDLIPGFRDTMERYLGKLGRKFQQWNPSRPGNLVKLENPEFEKKFAVYSTDEQECRYILTPSMMERLLEMTKRIKFKVAVSFRNNQVYIAVFNNLDLFEPAVFGSLLKEEDYRIIINMMKLMTGIIEDLNLNTRIWTKE